MLGKANLGRFDADGKIDARERVLLAKLTLQMAQTKIRNEKDFSQKHRA